MSPPSQLDEDFIAHLEDLVRKRDTGALAALRRGLGKPPGTVYEMFPHVQWAAAHARSRWEEDTYYILATLFAAWHQGRDNPVQTSLRNLGASLRQWATTQSGTTDENRLKSIESRFSALLAAHLDDLHNHLRHAISLLRSADIPLNWPQLLADLKAWNHPDRYVQREWARAFWAPQPSQKDQHTPVEETA